MFDNSRTKSKSHELKAHKTETEAESKVRLETMGWVFPPDAIFNDAKKTWTLEEEPAVEGDKAADGDGFSKGGGPGN